MRAGGLACAGLAAALSVGCSGDDPGVVYRFTATPCPVPVVDELAPAVECGLVDVPLDYGDVGAGSLQVAVARIRALDGLGEAPPVFWLEGGPGDAAIGPRLNYALTTLRSTFGFTRDIVLIDPRGTGASVPAMECADLDPLRSGEFEVAETIAAANLRTLDALRRCRGELRVADIDPWHFNGVWSALDVDAVRQALGYDRISLLATSWGTLTAQRVMAATPERIVGVVLDAVVPAAGDWIDQAPASTEAALRDVFAACASQTLCNAAFPELPAHMLALLERLAAAPLPLRVTTSDGVTRDAQLTAGRFAAMVAELLLSPGGAGQVPRLVSETVSGETGLLRLLLTRDVDNNDRFDGTYWSSVCSEQPAEAFNSLATPVQTALGTALAEQAAVYRDACQMWSERHLDPRALGLLRSRVPTLTLTGEFDPVAPAANAAVVAAGLSQVHSVEVHGVSHGTLDTGCARQIAAGFLANPTVTPVSRCAREGTVRFDPGREMFSPPNGSYLVPLPIGWTTRSLDTVEQRFSTTNRASLAVGYMVAGSVDEGLREVRRTVFDDFVGRRVTTTSRWVAGREWTEEFWGESDDDVMLLAGTWLVDVVWVVAIRGPRDDVQTEIDVFNEALERFGIVGLPE